LVLPPSVFLFLFSTSKVVDFRVSEQLSTAAAAEEHSTSIIAAAAAAAAACHVGKGVMKQKEKYFRLAPL
jgi:hypothetical protein